MGLEKVETLFNEIFEFDKFVIDSKKYIEDTLQESDTNFLSEEFEDDCCFLKQLNVVYAKTQLFVNVCEREPYFRLQFYLYNQYNSENPQYIYELEYDSTGNFSDEYFLEYWYNQSGLIRIRHNTKTFQNCFKF